MTDPNDYSGETSFELTPLWSDQEIESLLTGHATVDADLDEALGRLRTLARQEPVPEPRADVLAMLEGAVPPPRRSRNLMVAIVATLGISSFAVAGAAVASETVHAPLRTIVHTVLDGLEGDGTATPPPPAPVLPPGAIQIPNAHATHPTSPGHDPTGPGNSAGAGSSGVGAGQRSHSAPGGPRGQHGATAPADPPPPGGQRPGHGRPPGQGESRGAKQRHTKDHGQGQGQRHAYGHTKDHGHGTTPPGQVKRHKSGSG